MTRYEGYQGNPNLPRESYIHSFSQYEVDEFRKCVHDPVYFATTYIRIVNVDRGLMPFEMWDFQKDMLRSFDDNRFSICKLPRQVGKTTTAVAFLLHYILFNKDVNVAILANKSSTAREIMGRLQLAFEYLPRFLQQGVKEWNKGNIELANGSKAQADSTSGSSVRGKSFNVIFLDEFAHIPNNIAHDFFMSTYPTISSGNSTKVIIVSTPKGMNLFYRMWMDATEKRSDYVPIEIHWSMVPGRDEKWKELTIKNTSQDQFDQEFECNFIGSTNTLIHPSKIRQLVMLNPIEKDESFSVYERPDPSKTYVISVDVAEGQEKDFSTFSVIDVTQIPYKQVAKYKNNKVTPFLYPTVIFTAAKKYNDAFILVEINSIGLQVADILHNELAYENLIKIQGKGKHGQQVTPGYTKRMQMGLKQSVQTKKIGCANLKSLIENEKLVINDADTIMELTTFSEHKTSFAAEEGNNDDLVMTLVNFGWLTAQRYFKESVQNDIRRVLQEEQLNLMDQDLVPFGIIDNGLNSMGERDKDGDYWVEDRQNRYPFDDMNMDWRSKL